MRATLIGRYGAAAATLSAVLALAACGGNDPTTNPGGGGGGGGAEYKVTDLCAQADFAPLKAVLPVVTELKPDQRTGDGYTVYSCAGQAAKTDQYDDIGFITLKAYDYGSSDQAAEHYETETTSAGVTDLQPAAGLGDQGSSYINDPEVTVVAQIGNLLLLAHWSPNSGPIPGGVREALVETAKATVSKLKAA